MGQMALGYGSEFHLLRWLGRHRNEFDNKIKHELKIDNVTWLDFDFDEEKTIPDKELIGLSFLKEEINYSSILSEWRNEWPQTGSSMNWDLVGFTIQNGTKTWLLLEAKAHLGELEQSCGASVDSFTKIEKALKCAAANNQINVLSDSPWTKKYYQLANRIYVLDLLKRCGIRAKLINIYFIGDMIFKTRKSPQNKEEWLTGIDKMKKYLNLYNTNAMGIVDLFLDIDK